MKRFLISDTHFNHKNIIQYEHESRGHFESVDAMNKDIIVAWNSVVGHDDIVYFLGDFGMGGSGMFKEFLSQLNGRIRIVLGNHDPKKSQQWYLNLGFDRVYDQSIILDGFYILSHAPIPYMSDSMPYVNIHGHTHGESYSNPQRYNVSWEITDGVPVDFEDIKAHYVELQQVKDAQRKMWKERHGEGMDYNDGYVTGFIDAKKGR